MDVIDYAAASLPPAAAAKKQRVGNNDIENITMPMPEEAFCLLLSIPKEVLEHVLSYLRRKQSGECSTICKSISSI